MAENVYEGLFILDAGRYARDQTGTSQKIDKMIESAGGEVLVSRLWEERRLAYAIKGSRKGVYWLTYFRMEGEKLAPLTRESEISDHVLRQLFVKLHPKLVDAIVSHAVGDSPADDAPDDAPAEDGPADAEEKEVPKEKQSSEAVAATS